MQDQNTAPENQTGKTHPSEPQEENATSQFVKEVIKFALLAVIIVVPVRLYVASPFIVSGSSMSPTFETGNYLIVDQLSYTLGGTPERGEVIIFRFPNNPEKFFIKRVIGLPEETVIIRDGSVSIKNEDLVQPLPLTEPYVKSTSDGDTTATLGKDEYFVMGDNRSGSSDSRAWGPLPEDLITGRAFIRLFPITDMELLPGEYNY